VRDPGVGRRLDRFRRRAFMRALLLEQKFFRDAQAVDLRVEQL
jgi:hypothetical protein